jgi:hypothetical protein
MPKNFPKTGKKVRPKTATKGKRYRCAICRKRSPKAVKTSAPWYCPTCLRQASEHDCPTAVERNAVVKSKQLSPSLGRFEVLRPHCSFPPLIFLADP